MSYHVPDPIWAVFSAPDFESYAEAFVVEGRFHRDVPEAVRESYAVAEQIMAHAYYHYPMYEEALVKLLRTLEMAVRLRCEQIGITTTFTDKKGEIQGKNLGSLFDQLAKQEPSKTIKKTLNRLRKLRNILMHPKDKLLLGATAINAVQHTLVQLNALFLPEQFFVEAQKALESMQSRWRPFEQGQFILDQGGKQSVIYESNVVEAYSNGSEWVYLVRFCAIFKAPKENLEQGHHAEPVLLVLRDVTEEPGMIRGTNATDGLPVILFATDRPDIQAVSDLFQAELASVEPMALSMFQASLVHAVEQERVHCQCTYWCGDGANPGISTVN